MRMQLLFHNNFLFGISHSIMLQESQRVLVQVVPNLHKRHILIELFLCVVSMIPLVGIVDIPRHRRHGLRVNDPLAIFCGRVCFLFIILIAAVLVDW